MVETDDEGLIDKAEEERLEIIAKYDKGREEGHNIDPWEDPGFEIYHVTDFYGFIHDNRLPSIGADEIKRKNHEVERIDKWLKMHKGWEKYKNSEKLKKRVYKGIPNRLRGLFWSLLLDLEPLQNQQKGKYQEMYELARKYSPDIRQIDLDVNRTFRDHINFRERFGVKQKSLFNILSAYSIYNSEVGYCQGMSQIAALLLLYLNEEEAFWAFAQLMTHHRYAMHGFFIAGFPKLLRFQSHHDRVLTTMLPKLKKHFDKHCVDAGLYTLKWFFQCFLDRVPYELALRYWDIYLLEGEKVLICGAYAILKMHNKSLLGKKNMDDILTYLQSKLPTNFDYDTDTAIKFFANCSEELHRKKLDTAGEPGDEELVKKPFGVIDNILPNPIPKPKKKPPRNTVSSTVSSVPEIRTSSSTAEIPNSSSTSEILNRSSTAEILNSSSTTEILNRSSTTEIPNSSNSSHRHTIDVLENSSRSRSTTPSSSVNIPQWTPHSPPQSLSHIPSGETVRIHVPYNSLSTSSSHHSFELSTTVTTTPTAARNGFDLNKSDPNRIKIDVSGGGILG